MMSSKTRGVRNIFERVDNDLNGDGFCHCYYCDVLVDGGVGELKGTLSDIIPGKKCSSLCGKLISRACSNKKRRCSDCQLFCLCSLCSGVHQINKATLWTLKEALDCGDCGRTQCISEECGNQQRVCNRCFIPPMRNTQLEEQTAQLEEEYSVRICSPTLKYALLSGKSLQLP